MGAPYIIIYFDNKTHTRRVTPIKYDLEEVNSWWRVMRSRLDWSPFVIPLSDFNKNMENPAYRDWINNKRDTLPPIE